MKIYKEGIVGDATFESETPDWEKWDAGHLSQFRRVVEKGNVVLGWTAFSQVSSRKVYAGVEEVSIYVYDIAQKLVIGFMLMERLINSSEESRLWTLQVQIFTENTTSIRLHKKHGFHQKETRKRIALMTQGPMAGEWLAVVLLERRSQRVGI